ncbi:hypothetical protein Y032_0119g841 [Ancylostoma ceylanicum]|uniref:SCP domain-containing protein n=1 Tax=Ancylostoma ceylanicum TaxID=53326 RepID=A0A016TB82_9BILA|nr:hypothetical protein Y032_0119g841 [Ancylostoma ceylanicum]
MGWSCELEKLAFAGLNETCSKKSPTAPDGLTGFFDYIEKPEETPWPYRKVWGLGFWFSEIDHTIMDAPDDGAPVFYYEVNRNYSNVLITAVLEGKFHDLWKSREWENWGCPIIMKRTVFNRNLKLIRYDASRIGCAGMFCNGTKDQYNLFCLTDKPPLEKYEIIYYAGKGPCPAGRCRQGYECHEMTGLCVRRSWHTTTTPPPTTTCKKIYVNFGILLDARDNCKEEE